MLVTILAAVTSTATLLPLAPIDAPDIPISADNPFFDKTSGLPHFTPMPHTLREELYDAGCAYAWRRQQHTHSALDVTCDALLRPFLQGSVGSLLGFLFGILSDERFLTQRPYALMTSPALLKHSSLGASADFSSLGSPGEAPPLFTPQLGLSTEELRAEQAKGGINPEAYFCLLYTSPSPRDGLLSRMPSSA